MSGEHHRMEGHLLGMPVSAAFLPSPQLCSDLRTTQDTDERTIASVPVSVRSRVSLGSTGEKKDVDVEATKAEQDKDDDDSDVTRAPVPPSFPEGGLQGWSVVAGSFLIQFCCFGYTSSFGVYQDFYVREYMTNENASTISWIGSMNAFLVMATGLIAGWISDRGHFKFAVYGGSLLLALGLFMLSLAQRNQFYQVFLSQGICAGIGSGLLFVPSYAVVGHWFLRRRALAMTIVASGSSLGATIHPIMLNNLFDTLGFGNTVRASAGLVTGMLLIACLLVRTRLPPPEKTMSVVTAVKKFSRDLPYVTATAGLTIFLAGLYYPLYYLQLDASAHNLSPTFSFYSIVIMNFCSCVGRLTSGFVAHTFGVANTITVLAGCCAAIIIGMIGVKSVVSVVLVGIFVGFFLGAYIALMSPLLATLADEPAEIGMRMGIAYTIAAFGGLVGTPINGALLGNGPYSWWKPAVFSGVMCFCGFAFFLATTLVVYKRHKNAEK